MRNNKLSVILLLVSSLSLLAADEIKPEFRAPSSYYKSSEFSVDSFALVRTTTFNDERTGVGIGAQYYVNDNLGFRAEGITKSWGGRSQVDEINWSVLYRLPVGKAAPYGLVGGDWDLEKRDFLVHVGLGAEYRFTKHVGIFTEARMNKGWNYSNPTAEGRAGLRIAF